MFKKLFKKKNPLEIKIFLSANGEHPETIFTSLGITRDRANELQDKIKEIQKNIAKNGNVYNDEVMRELSLFCKNANEFALSLYTFGVENTLNEVHARGAGPGDFLSKLLGGGLGSIIRIGGGKFSKGERPSETSEDPSIEELIRRSYEINKDDPKKDE